MSIPLQPESKLDLSGQRLGDYDLLMRLASGGMGAVYVARAAKQGGFERLFAVKCCHSFLLEDPAFLPMFMDEARISALVRHPNVVATVDVGETQNVPYLVMEYVEGVPLTSLLRHAVQESLMLPVGLVVRVIIDALHGLHATHETCDLSGQPLGLIHRDVSPQNLIVGLDGTTRLADFGVAKAASRSSVTREGTIKGKFAYVAPEALRLEPVDRRADLFAIGVVLWEALESKRLFVGPSDPETLQRVLHLPVPKLQAREGITPELEAVLTCALHRDPHKRFASAAEMAHALERLRVAANASEVGKAVQTLFGAELAAKRQELASSIRKRAESASGNIPAPGRSVTPPPMTQPATRAPMVALGLALLVAVVSVAGATYVLTRPPIVATQMPDSAELPPLPATTTPVLAVPVTPTVEVEANTEANTTEANTEANAVQENPREATDQEPHRPRIRTPRLTDESTPRRPNEFRPTEL